MIRTALNRLRAYAVTLGLLALAVLAALAFGAALDRAATASRYEEGVESTRRNAEAAAVAQFNEGFADGRADGMGDDDRDGRVERGEQGWSAEVLRECAGAGRALRLCVTVASRPAYGWANPDGSRADNPDGRAMVRDLEERPGTPGFAAALRALDAEWRAHH